MDLPANNMEYVEPTISSDKPANQFSKKAVTLIISISIVGVILIVIVIIGIIMLTKRPTAPSITSLNQQVQNALTAKSLKNLKAVPTTPSFPFTINDNDRLILKIQNVSSSMLTYIYYKYPSGTYSTLNELVNALNYQDNYQAIYFSSLNTTWWINAFLTWGISNAGNLTFTWTDAVYNQIIFLTTPPTNDPRFAISNTSGINDSSTNPNWSGLVTALNINTNLAYSLNQTVVVNFPIQ